MNIGLSTSVIQRGKTGIAQYLFALLRALQKSGTRHRLTLFVLDEDRPLFEEFRGTFEQIPVAEKFRPPIRNILWHQTELPRLAAKHHIDLLHVPSYRRLIWSSLCPAVGTIHDLAPFRVSKKYDLARMFYGRVIAKQFARRQNAIIAVSENTARDIEHFFRIPRNRIHVIHNGLEHDRFFPRDPAESQAHVASKFGLDRPYFLYVARLEHPGKNHVRLIEAFEKFKDASSSPALLAFGGSDWHGAEIIHERIRNSKWRSDIGPLGFIPNEDLPALYSAARAFVYPSLFEGFGMPPVEAMACGCPVICSDRGSLGEVVGSAAQIIEPENVSSICEALSLIENNQKTRLDFIQRGLSRSREFSWERTALETLSVYESAVCTQQHRRNALPGSGPANLAGAALSGDSSG
jgi:glycosyltransferase involved in cell wall biosynthesis